MEKEKSSKVDDLLDILNSRFYKKPTLPPMSNPISPPRPADKPDAPKEVSKLKDFQPQKRFDEEIEINDLEGQEENGLPEELPTMKNFFPTQSKVKSTTRNIHNNRLRTTSTPEEESHQNGSLERQDARHQKQQRTKGFAIRKMQTGGFRKTQTVPGQSVLNLVPEITPDINKKEEYRPNLHENRLAHSKHMLFKTFNRYLTNPASFQLKPAINDLVNLNANFEDANLARKLFRTGCHPDQNGR